MRKIMPLPEKVIVRVHPQERLLPGGLYISDTAEDRRHAWEATVLGVGPGRLLPSGKRQAADVHQGEQVLIPRRAARLELKSGQELLQILDQDEILAVIEADVVVDPDEFAKNEALTSCAYVVREGDSLLNLLTLSDTTLDELHALNTRLEWTPGIEITVPRKLGLYLIARDKEKQS